jgi:hypothetical protein
MVTIKADVRIVISLQGDDPYKQEVLDALLDLPDSLQGWLEHPRGAQAHDSMDQAFRRGLSPDVMNPGEVVHDDS